jgi:hypothetical protein
MKNKTTLVGAIVVGCVLLVGAWLFNRKDRGITTADVQAAPANDTTQQPAPTAKGGDYRAIFSELWSSEWLPPESKIDTEEFLCDAAYCNNYLDWLISAQDLEWGAFLARSSLTSADKARFIELIARRELALKQAVIAARALGADAGKNGRSDLLASVSGEYDNQIKAVIGEKQFTLFLAYEKEGMLTLLEPFFNQVASTGELLSVEQEKSLIEKMKASHRTKAFNHKDAMSILLAFDPAADESGALSLEQVLVLREYQNAVRSTNKQKTRSEKVQNTESENKPTIKQWSADNFSKNIAKEWSVTGPSVDLLKMKLSGLITNRINSEDFSNAITTLVGVEKFAKLVDIARTDALEKNMYSIQRKLRASGLDLKKAEQKNIRVLLELYGSDASATAIDRKAPADSAASGLPQEIRVLVERHLRGQQAARKLQATIDQHDAMP